MVRQMRDARYLVGYDISDPQAQARLRYRVKGYSATGQRSAYECQLSADTCQLLAEYAAAHCAGGDGFFALQTRRTYWAQVTTLIPSLPSHTPEHHLYIG